MRVESAESGRKPRRIRAWAIVAGLLVLALAGFWFSAIMSASRQEVWFTSERIPGIGKRIRMLKPANWEASPSIVPGSRMVYFAAPVPRLTWLRIPAIRRLLKLDEVEDAALNMAASLRNDFVLHPESPYMKDLTIVLGRWTSAMGSVG